MDLLSLFWILLIILGIEMRITISGYHLSFSKLTHHILLKASQPLLSWLCRDKNHNLNIRFIPVNHFINQNNLEYITFKSSKLSKGTNLLSFAIFISKLRFSSAIKFVRIRIFVTWVVYLEALIIKTIGSLRLLTSWQ